MGPCYIRIIYSLYRTPVLIVEILEWGSIFHVVHIVRDEGFWIILRCVYETLPHDVLSNASPVTQVRRQHLAYSNSMHSIAQQYNSWTFLLLWGVRTFLAPPEHCSTLVVAALSALISIQYLLRPPGIEWLRIVWLCSRCRWLIDGNAEVEMCQ